MTKRSIAHSKGLCTSVLALTTSVSIIAGICITATPAYSIDGVPDTAASCLEITEGEATVRFSSILHAGDALHLEGSGWTPTSDDGRAFVIMTLDGGKELRPADTELPTWVPSVVVRNKSAWAVAEVGADGSFVTDIAIPASWRAGSTHQIAIGDSANETSVEAVVRVAEEDIPVLTCTLGGANAKPALPDSFDDSDDDTSTTPGTDELGGDETPALPLTAPASGLGESAATAPGASTPQAPNEGASADNMSDSQALSSLPSPAPSAPSGPAIGSRPGSPATAGIPTPDPTSSTEPQSVSASQIGPKARSEQQANEEAACEEEGRLNGWILAGGGLLTLLGAVATVSIVRRSHGGVH